MSRSEDQIREAMAGHSTRLDLQFRFLIDIPDIIFMLPWLEELNLNGNNIRVVPKRIRKLLKLKELNLCRNPIENVPDIPGLHLDWEAYMRCRKGLSPAHVVGINVRTGEHQAQPYHIPDCDQIPSELVRLSALRSLRIGVDGVTIQEPLELQEPDLPIIQIIDRLDELPALQELTLWGVPLKELPISIRKLRRLRSIQIIGEYLKEVLIGSVNSASLRSCFWHTIL